MLLALALSLIIGLLLGLLGGGGSILTLPMLVYVLNIEAKDAVLISLVVVGLSSLMALLPHARRGSVCWKSGFLFGIAGMSGAYGGAHLAAHCSTDLLMSVFGAVSLLTGGLMLFNKTSTSGETHGLPPRVCPLKLPLRRILFDGFWVGLITGLVGVGGGFLIVPALTLFVGLPMQGAVGTSLLVITLNATAGLVGYSQHISLDWSLTAWVAGGATLGSLIGAWLSNRIKPHGLRKTFALMVVAVAVAVLQRSLSHDLIASLQRWLNDPGSRDDLWHSVLLIIAIVGIGYWIHKNERVTFTTHHSGPSQSA